MEREPARAFLRTCRRATGAGNLAWLEDGWLVHAPVGSFRPNGFGLHDVIGNVWEWCRDGSGGYDADVNPGDALREVTGARLGGARGGGYNFTAVGAPEYRYSDLGVRPARVIRELLRRYADESEQGVSP